MGKSHHKPKMLELIRWINNHEKFTYGEITKAFKEGWNPHTIGSTLTSMRRAGYLSKGDQRGKWIVDKTCPDNADLSNGRNEFNGMF